MSKTQTYGCVECGEQINADKQINCPQCNVKMFLQSSITTTDKEKVQEIETQASKIKQDLLAQSTPTNSVISLLNSLQYAIRMENEKNNSPVITSNQFNCHKVPIIQSVLEIIKEEAKTKQYIEASEQVQDLLKITEEMLEPYPNIETHWTSRKTIFQSPSQIELHR